MSAEDSLSMVAAVLASPPLLKITDIRVSNFRSLHNVEVKLDELTVLIGANNAGKTTSTHYFYSNSRNYNIDSEEENEKIQRVALISAFQREHAWQFPDQSAQISHLAKAANDNGVIRETVIEPL